MKTYSFLRKRCKIFHSENKSLAQLVNAIFSRVFSLNQTNSYRINIVDTVLGAKDSDVAFEFDFTFGDNAFIEKAEYMNDSDCRCIAITFAEMYYEDDGLSSSKNLRMLNHVLSIEYYGENAQGLAAIDAIVPIVEAIAKDIPKLNKSQPFGMRYIPGSIDYDTRKKD